MGRVVITHERDVEWRWSDAKTWKGAREGEPRVRYKLLGRADEGGPNTQLCEYEPGHVERPHSHPHDELLYILGGEGELEDQALEPGLLVFIEKDTVYGPLSTGESGLRFLRVQVSD